MFVSTVARVIVFLAPSDSPRITCISQDDLLLLKKGGEVVYHGELGSSSSALISYFESKGAPRIEVGENPANWMLRVISRMGDLSATYRDSEECTQVMQDLHRLKETQVPDTEIKYESVYAVSQVRREELVNARLRTIYWRSPTYNLTRLSVSGIIAFILGSVFLRNWRRNQFTEIEMRARLSVIFLAFIITGIMSIVSVLPVMQDIKMMFRRHADAGMYGSQALGIALGVAEKWFIVGGGAIFTAIFLSTSHINNAPFSAGFWVSRELDFCRNTRVTNQRVLFRDFLLLTSPFIHTLDKPLFL